MHDLWEQEARGVLLSAATWEEGRGVYIPQGRRAVTEIGPWKTEVKRVGRKGFKWSERSLRNLEGIHPDLRKVCDLALALTSVDFLVTCGLRTEEEQLELFKKGATRTMKSRHLTGHAIDYVAWDHGQPSYAYPLMERVARAFKTASKRLGIPIVWGGDWETFKDTPHIELCKRTYPA